MSEDNKSQDQTEDKQPDTPLESGEAATSGEESTQAKNFPDRAEIEETNEPVDFGHYRKASNIGANVRECLLAVSINGHTPRLKVKPAHQSNKDYWNNYIIEGSRIKGAREEEISRQIEELKKEGLISNTTATLDALTMILDYELYPHHIIVDWDEVYNSNGRRVPYTPENGEKLIRSFECWVFQDLRQFCNNINNFRNSEFEEITIQEANELAGN